MCTTGNATCDDDSEGLFLAALAVQEAVTGRVRISFESNHNSDEGVQSNATLGIRTECLRSSSSFVHGISVWPTKGERKNDQIIVGEESRLIRLLSFTPKWWWVHWANMEYSTECGLIRCDPSKPT